MLKDHPFFLPQAFIISKIDILKHREISIADITKDLASQYFEYLSPFSGNSCRHHCSSRHAARSLLDALIRSDVGAAVMRRVVGIEDLDAVTFFLQVWLHAVPCRAELRGAAAVFAHARVAPVLISADEIGRWRCARYSTLAAGLLVFGGQETGGFAVAAVVIRRVVDGAKLANVGVHADVAV